MAVLDFVLSIPFMGDAVGALIAGLVGVQIRGFLHRTTAVVNLRGKKSFELLPSWVKALFYKGLLEAQTAFPAAKQEELLDVACDRAKNAIKGKLDDVIIDAARKELKNYLRELYADQPITAIAGNSASPVLVGETPKGHDD